MEERGKGNAIKEKEVGNEMESRGRKREMKRNQEEQRGKGNGIKGKEE